MKKIGICTLYNANNFGAILQAFSLQEILKNMGYEVEFLKFEGEYAAKSEENQEKFDLSRNCLNICKHNFSNEKDYYDTIIIGSDEMWNIKNSTFKHLREYFGYNMNCKNIVAYAPSANNTTAEDLKKFYENKIDFSKFNHLSARDLNTFDLVKNVSNKDATLVLDPTLLLETFDKYIKYDNDLTDYIAVYGYNFSHEEIEKILKFAREKNKKVYSIGFKFDWCDMLEADIFEFLGYMKNADYIIASTFHSLLFSVILEKQFCIFANGKHKIKDFINMFDISDREVKENQELGEIFEKEVDYERINKLKLKKRKDSIMYLTKAIEGSDVNASL